MLHMLSMSTEGTVALTSKIFINSMVSGENPYNNIVGILLILGQDEGLELVQISCPSDLQLR